MQANLDTIYNRGRTRKGHVAWYKLPTKGAACPPENRQISIADSYFRTFGCTDSESFVQRHHKMKQAKQCASERMAQMNHIFKTGGIVDREHVYPIKLAYGLGKQCVQMNYINNNNTGINNEFSPVADYNKSFATWYNELVGNSPVGYTNTMFRNSYAVRNNHPLIGFNIVHNQGTSRARAYHTLRANSQGNASGAGAGAGDESEIKNNNSDSNNFISSSFARQGLKGKGGGSGQTVRRRNSKRYSQTRKK